MPDLTKVIRSYVGRDIGPPKQLAGGAIPDDSTVTDPVKLEWGQSGSVRILHGSINIMQTYYAIKKMRERPKTT
ncbi:MAG TPA: hypothetical protein VFK30_06535 [Anaerolineae bacterium]|nr:hypothetical protein [Anaerolineae bacterium]